MTAYLVTILSLVGIAIILGLALNLQWGLCGMVNFGMAGFFAVAVFIPSLSRERKSRGVQTEDT